jgi:cob(I)alamin adenosyltransferase
MVKLNKIYTRTGDQGQTGLVDGSRIAKHAPRMVAIGDVDELNSLIGVAVLHIRQDEYKAMLDRVQNELFDVGADLATPGEDFEPGEWTLRIVPSQVARLEAEIDAMNATMPPLSSFVLPGGEPGAAHVHVARATARRAERSAVSAADSASINPLVLIYLNRLSDHLFVMARAINAQGSGDVLWQPGATR